MLVGFCRDVAEFEGCIAAARAQYSLVMKMPLLCCSDRVYRVYLARSVRVWP
jgi:hypothetical protein